jgi:hypothetical protein
MDPIIAIAAMAHVILFICHSPLGVECPQINGGAVQPVPMELMKIIVLRELASQHKEMDLRGWSMIPKSGYRFSEKITLKQKVRL